MADARIGTAGWSIPLKHSEAFPADGSSLERYSAIFNCSEINSSFHRPHRPTTYQRWQEAVPEQFRFSVKLPKTITHKQRLIESERLVDAFLAEILGLGGKAAVILVQLPPSLAFDEAVAANFFDMLQAKTELRLACEPRHPSWFDTDADLLLRTRQIARVAADPSKPEAAAQPGGWRGLSYYRLHGSPVPYRSSYDPERIASYAAAIAADLQGGNGSLVHLRQHRFVGCRRQRSGPGRTSEGRQKIVVIAPVME